MAKSNGKPKFRVPNLDNATPASLVDELGIVREKIKNLEKAEGIYKEALKGRIEDGQQLIEGAETHNATIEEVEQSRLNSDLVKRTLGGKGYQECCKAISFQVIRTLRKPST